MTKQRERQLLARLRRLYRRKAKLAKTADTLYRILLGR